MAEIQNGNHNPMNHPPSLAELTANLVPFSARQVASALIWCDPNVEDAEALRQACSYLIDPASTAPARIFHAERYGGGAIQRNGGGARCGFDGHYHVKGMGANQLAGVGSDKRHSNGALSAVHAIYEALWGEVLAQLLPFGAVRTRAVLLTDSYTDIAFGESQLPSRRALLIREPMVRPGHFERAPYFRPKPEFAAELMHDASRVRAVIRMLPANLPTPAAGFSEEAMRDPQRYCIEGLCELARRQAWQMSFCRTRFLRLTTSPSNVAMDGRLLDFNGLNCLFPGDYRNDFGYRLRRKELVREPAILQQGLSDLCLYLGKYLFDPAFTAISRQLVGNAFQKNFQEASYRGYLELLGIPEDLLPPTELPETLKQCVHRFMKWFDSLSETLYCPPHNEQSESPLERLVIGLIHRSQGKKISYGEELESNVHFPEVLRSLTDAVVWLAKNAQSQGIEKSDILKRMEQHARKRLQPRACLSKERMFEDIAGLFEMHGNDMLSLQQAFTAMGERVLSFSSEALGCQQPVELSPERD